jgi:UDP-glucuronate 4-epimerase
MPMREDALPQPVSPYGVTKLAAEQLCHLYYVNERVPTVSLRYFTVYGPRQRPDLAIHKFAAMMARGESIPLYGDGGTRRDYTFIGDIVSGIRAALDYEGAPYSIMNLGRGATVSLADLVAALEDILGVEALIDRQSEQPGDVPQTWADISKARAELGYEPRTSLRDGIAAFVEWLRGEGGLDA